MTAGHHDMPAFNHLLLAAAHALEASDNFDNPGDDPRLASRFESMEWDYATAAMALIVFIDSHYDELARELSEYATGMYSEKWTALAEMKKT